MIIRRQASVPFMLAGTVFCVCLVAANLLETKAFRVCGPISLTGGFLVFPISYILNDIIAEVWGFRKARLVIWTGFCMSFLVAALGGVACALPPISPGGDDAFCQVFAFTPQITVASLTAFVVGSLLNAKIMSKMKVAARHKGDFSYHFSIRSILSTFLGECADSVIFFPLAFLILPLILTGEPKYQLPTVLGLMGVQIVAKTLYGIFALPLTIMIVKRIKKAERVD